MKWISSRKKRIKFAYRVAAVFAILVVCLVSIDVITYGRSGKGVFTEIKDGIRFELFSKREPELKVNTLENIDIDKFEVLQSTDAILVLPTCPEWAEYEKIGVYNPGLDDYFVLDIWYFDQSYEKYIRMHIYEDLGDNGHYYFSIPANYTMINYEFSKFNIIEIIDIYVSDSGNYHTARFVIDSFVYTFFFNVDLDVFYDFIDNLEVY